MASQDDIPIFVFETRAEPSNMRGCTPAKTNRNIGDDVIDIERRSGKKPGEGDDLYENQQRQNVLNINFNNDGNGLDESFNSKNSDRIINNINRSNNDNNDNNNDNNDNNNDNNNNNSNIGNNDNNSNNNNDNGNYNYNDNDDISVHINNDGSNKCYDNDSNSINIKREYENQSKTDNPREFLYNGPATQFACR